MNRRLTGLTSVAMAIICVHTSSTNSTLGLRTPQSPLICSEQHGLDSLPA